MNSGDPLTIAFIERRPIAAARVLAAMEPSNAAALLDTLPTRFAARALSRSGLWSSSAIVARMAPASAAALLQELAYPDAATILRLAPATEREALLQALPQRLRRSFESSLAFPQDTVGAHMTTTVLALSPTHTVEDAILEISRLPQFDGDNLFVVDAERRLIGSVRIADLLRHRSRVALGEIMEREVASLPARARLSAIESREQWSRHLSLPVVNRQKQLLGALSRTSLRLGLKLGDTPPPRLNAMPGGQLIDAFAYSALELARLLAGASSQTERSKPKGGEP